jgi:hypothetical protein
MGETNSPSVVHVGYDISPLSRIQFEILTLLSGEISRVKFKILTTRLTTCG